MGVWFAWLYGLVMFEYIMRQRFSGVGGFWVYVEFYAFVLIITGWIGFWGALCGVVIARFLLGVGGVTSRFWSIDKRNIVNRILYIFYCYYLIYVNFMRGGLVWRFWRDVDCFNMRDACARCVLFD